MPNALWGLILAVYIILLILTLTALTLVNTTPRSQIDWAKAREFLESQYIPEAGLLRAATISYPDNETIWIASDNLLGARALRILRSPLADEVLDSLESYNGGWNGKHDILLLKSIGSPRNTTRYYLGSIGGYAIMWEKADGEILGDWEEYSDWIAYMALKYMLLGEPDKALTLYRMLVGLWDGYGLRDKVAREKGVYETYKLALAVYLYRALSTCGYTNLNQNLYDKWIEIVARAQRSDGGFITGYNVTNHKIIYIGDANTETTSIAVLAIYSNYPEALGMACKLSKLLNQPWLLDNMIYT